MALLSPNELEIMRILWEKGALKPSEIQQRLSQPVKNSALRWQLGALVEKGHLTRRKKGKAYYYQASTPRHSVFKKLTRSMAEVFCGGSAIALIGEMIESQNGLSEEDIRELQRIAANKTPSTKASTKKGS
jgi:BlaI family penicillinase repressor